MFKVVFLARRRIGAAAEDRPPVPVFRRFCGVEATERARGPLLVFTRTIDERGRRDLFEFSNAEIVLTRHDHVVSAHDDEAWILADCNFWVGGARV